MEILKRFGKEQLTTVMQILDFHCHVYPHAIAEKASDAVARVLPGPPGEWRFPTRRQLWMMCCRHRLRRALPRLFCVLRPRCHTKYSTSMSSWPERRRPAVGVALSFGTLHPDSPDPKGDVEHLLELGLKGVKLHPDMQGFA